MWRRFRLAAIVGVVALCLANFGAIAHAQARDAIGSRPQLHHAKTHHAKARYAKVHYAKAHHTHAHYARAQYPQASLRAAPQATTFGAPAGPLMQARLFERETIPSGPVNIRVSLGAQAMTVSVGGEVLYRWPISSGRIGYNTPHGTYHPQRLAVMWRSHKFHMSPMPHSIFFRGGYAIHGTYATAYLGARASHGCIRLSPGHAATLFSLVRGAGMSHTRITISGLTSPLGGHLGERSARKRAG